MNNVYLEGPNGVGKTTAAFYLCDKLGYKYVHHTVPEKSNRFLMKLGYILRELFTSNKVYDRCWYSEYVYGPVYRDKSVLTMDDVRKLTTFAFLHQSPVFVFLPENQDEALANLNKRQEVHPYTPTKEEFNDICNRYKIVCNISWTSPIYGYPMEYFKSRIKAIEETLDGSRKNCRKSN